METNPGPQRPVPAVGRILCSNVRGLAGNLREPSSHYDVLFCSKTFVSDMCHVSELLDPCFGRPVLLCRGKMPRARGMQTYEAFRFRSRNASKCGLEAFRQP